MSAAPIKAYRFATAAQWRACLLQGFLPAPGGGLAPSVDLGAHPVKTEEIEPVSAISVDRFGRLVWRLEDGELVWTGEAGERVGPIVTDGLIAGSRRLVADARWLWAFGAERVRRYDCDTLDGDAAISLADIRDRISRTVSQPVAFLDIASDGRDGLFALVATEGGGALVARVDCRGCAGAPLALPCGVDAPTQICAAKAGQEVVLLSERGDRLWVVSVATGALSRSLSVCDYAPCFSARRMSGDGRDRIGLTGAPPRQGDQASQAFCFVLLDGNCEPSQKPYERLWADEDKVFKVHDFAVNRDGACFATDRGIFRLDASQDCGAADGAAEALTPILHSPITANGRGWLRAEISADLPGGAELTASFASTDDPRIESAARAIAANTDLTVAARTELIWSSLETGAQPLTCFSVGGPRKADGEPFAIPLFSSQDRWLWLRLSLRLPPGAEAARIAELRVLYPEVSLMQNLPAIFRDASGPSGDFLRRLVGVLETTTQGLDRSIGSIAGRLGAGTAPRDWLDYLGGWLAMPWHQALPETSKRKLIAAAGEIMPRRGTREGLSMLLDVLFGEEAVEIVDEAADFAPIHLGGRGREGAALPGFLAGSPPGAALLGRIRLGRTRIPCVDAAPEPLDGVAPALRIRISSDADTRRRIGPLLADILADFTPAETRVRIAWGIGAPGRRAAEDIFVLDAEGPGALGRDSTIGRTRLAGRGGRIGEAGFGMGRRVD